VRSVTEDGEIQTTEAFVRQVVDRIQGVIEAKLTPPQLSTIPVLSTVYPSLNYQSPSFYPSLYNNVSPPQVGFQVASAPQVGYNVISAPQANTAGLRNVSEVAKNNAPPTTTIYDTNKRCWICNAEKHFASNRPNRTPKDTNATENSNTNNKPDLNNPYVPCRYFKKTGHTVNDCYRLVNKRIAEDAERIRINSLQPPATSARVFLSIDDPKPTRDKFVYIAATINGNVTRCLCDSGCDVNLLPVHFVNLEDVLPSDCKPFAAEGTPIDVIGHCTILIALENGFLIKTNSSFHPA